MIRIAVVSVAILLWSASAFAQDAAHGKQLFTDNKCGVCHSIAGVGNKKGELDDVGSKLSAADIRQWITSAPEMAVKMKAERKPPMKTYPQLTKQEVDDLVAYLQTLKKK